MNTNHPDKQRTLREPHPQADPLFGLKRAGGNAIRDAEEAIGVTALPPNYKDMPCVRGLACRLMREKFGGRYSWSDISLAIYGHRNHRRAVEGAKRSTTRTLNPKQSNAA